MEHTIKRSAMASALGLAIAMQAAVATAASVAGDAGVIKKTEERMAANHLEKCYGINAVGKNDCATGRGHACAGQATSARDPDSFVLVPEGACLQIEGGLMTLREGKG